MHGVAERRQDEAEKAVLLKAVAAAATVDERGLERCGIELDWPAHLDVEVLERDGGDVGAMQAHERWQIGAVHVRRADARKVGGKVERIRHVTIVATSRVWNLRRCFFVLPPPSQSIDAVHLSSSR